MPMEREQTGEVPETSLAAPLCPRYLAPREPLPGPGREQAEPLALLLGKHSNQQ